MSIGKRLALLRGRKKQSEIEAATGIKGYVISKHENNIQTPNPEELRIYAEYYGVTSDFIIGVENREGKPYELEDFLFNTTISLHGELMTNEEKALLLKMSETIIYLRENKL